MTCQDCIHISSKQVGKADNFPLYTCNKTSFLVKGIATPCKDFQRKSACDDCIYTYPDCPTGEIDKKFDEVHGDNFNVVSCVNYVNNDGSYHDGHWHCHRCGKIVEVAGLCYECEMDLYGMRPPTKEERESVNKYIDSISVETGITIDDSWESVSK